MVYTISRTGARFDWDLRKAEANRVKHGARFEEAATAFDDPDRLELFDREHSTSAEERGILIGRSESKRILYVSFTLRKQRIRIISARRATRKERNAYENKTA